MSTSIKRNKGIKLIRKSNGLIEARYRFDIWEMRIFTKILSLIQPSDEDFKPFRIYLQDVIRDFHLQKDKASYDNLRHGVDSLMEKKFFVPQEGNGVTREDKYHIIRKVNYLKSVQDESKRAQNEYIDIHIEPEIKPLLLQLKEKFTSYDIRNIIKFQSSYTLRIYEHLKQYERIGERILEVDYLKRVFELTQEYPRFPNFYQRIIQPAIRDINRHTDLNITHVEKMKRGRSVYGILFKFVKKDPLPVAIAEVEKSGIVPPPPSKTIEVARTCTPKTAHPEPVPIACTGSAHPAAVMGSNDHLYLGLEAKVVKLWGVSPITFVRLLEEHSEADIHNAVAVTEWAVREQKAHDAAGYFVKAVRERWTNRDMERNKRAAALHATEQQQKACKAQLQDLMDEFESRKNDKIREITHENDAVTIRAIAAAKEMPSVRRWLERKGMSDPTVDDFRADRFLRAEAKKMIIEQNITFFQPLLDEYQPRFVALGGSMW